MQRTLNMGAYGFTAKPASHEHLMEAFQKLRNFVKRRTKTLLLVDSDDAQRAKAAELIAGDDIQIEALANTKQAIEQLKAQEFDCIVLNMTSATGAGMETLGKIRELRTTALPPLVLYSSDESRSLSDIAASLSTDIVVREARTPGELLDETAMFMHRTIANLSEDRRQMLNQLRQREPSLQGSKILIVDDDIRNIFSLTSVLEQHKVEVVYAENGRDGIEILKSMADVDVALIDIMMPEMDGYQTMHEIRQHESLKQVPLIAVTAKAMKGDRQKCMEAGASDYIAKPVDIDLLLALLRVWIERGPVRRNPQAAVPGGPKLQLVHVAGS
jgi:CheY-like chemotaxis protein